MPEDLEVSAGTRPPRGDPRLSSVGIEVYRATHKLLLEVGERLRERHGSRIHLYVRSPAELQHFRKLNADGRWASITLSGGLTDALKARDLDEDAVIRRARELERRIGTTLTQVGFSERLFISGHSPGQMYPRNDRALKAISYVQFLHAFNEHLSFWETEIERAKLTLLLQGDKAAACMARAGGALFRILDPARYENRWMWQTNEYYFSHAVETAYHELESWSDLEIDVPYGHAVAKDALTVDRLRPSQIVRRTARAAAVHVYYMLTGNPKAKTMPFGDFVLSPYRGYRAHRRMRGTDTVTLDQLAGRPFAYFPLHKEPETGLQLLSPEQCNQQNVIMSIARELPAGMLLALKENVNSLGRRPEYFYDQLMRLKNVVFLNIHEPGIAVAQKAALTVSITGTAGFEAAAMGKPVISYGDHNMYNVVPHVMVVRGENDVGPFIARAISPDFDGEKARRDGKRFLNAVVRSSFDLHEFSLGSRDRFSNFGPETVESAYQGLVDSLDVEDVTAVLRQGS